VQFWLLAAFLVCVFALGGSSRGDAGSLAVLRPLSALTLGVGCLSLEWAHVRRFRYLFALAGACVALPALQLLPLPSNVFEALPGRSIVGEIGRLAGTGGAWRPLSLAPARTWNALWSLMAPLATLVLGAQLPPRELRRLLDVVLAIGLADVALSVAQVFGDPTGPLYFYADTNAGSPVGFFANRNHQAVFLASLLPMLAAWPAVSGGARQSLRLGRRRALAALAVGLALVPLILLTGSRTGTLVALAACLSVPAVLNGGAGGARGANAGAPGGRRRWLAPAGAAAGLGLVVASIWVGRAVSVDRLFGTDLSQDLRYKILPTVRGMAHTYWPLGSGLGSFKPAYRLEEPGGVLMPLIMNQAHNDWLELPAIAGLPGLLILLAAGLLWLSRVGAFWAARGASEASLLARVGFVMVALLAAASVTDYPIRVPAISCLLAIAAMWLASSQVDDNETRQSTT
jgi:hypothetical protein